MPRLFTPKTVVTTAAIALAVTAIGLTVSPKPDGAAVAQTAPAAVPVEVAVMAEAPLRLWSEFSARLTAVDEVALRPQVSGTLVAQRFSDGQSVEKGDVLFVIDPRPFDAAVAQAEAELAGARDRRDLAAKELKRAKGLISSSVVSKSTLDERSNAFQVAESDVRVAEARLKRARIDLDHAYVKAPISGRVGRAELTVGNLVQAGPNAPVLTTIVSDDGIYADFEVDERTYLRQIRRQAKDIAAEREIPVRLSVDGISYDGRIHSFDNRIDPASGTIRARAYFANEDGGLVAGMFARLALGSAATTPAILLPERAVGTDQDRKFVYVVTPDNTVAYREVRLGAALEGRRVVTDGLRAGETVIIEGLLKVRPNMSVAPRDGAAANLAAAD